MSTFDSANETGQTGKSVSGHEALQAIVVDYRNALLALRAAAVLAVSRWRNARKTLNNLSSVLILKRGARLAIMKHKAIRRTLHTKELALLKLNEQLHPSD